MNCLTLLPLFIGLNIWYLNFPFSSGLLLSICVFWQLQIFKDFLFFFYKKVACCYQAVVVAVIVNYNAESSLFVTDHSKRHTVKKLNTSHQKWSEKDRQKNRSDGCNVRWIWWFEDEWRGDTSQGNQVSTWRSERQEMDSPLSHQVGIQACQHLDFAPWDPSLT